MNIGEVVKEYRDKNKLSQRQFAQRCKLSNGYISMLEEGKNPKTNEPIVPTIDTYKKIADGMHLSIDTLFGLLDDAPIVINKSPSNEYVLTEGDKKLIDLFRKVPLEKQDETLARIEFALLTLQ